ncbi:MAG: hypothetical protein K5847_04590, partial [Lachnospiraceae bacterium]|nr:hypothetical protein [Lachnospiraceae bacterium]
MTKLAIPNGSGTTVALDAEGKFTFTGLTDGVYILQKAQSDDGNDKTYDNVTMQTSLFTVPLKDEKGQATEEFSIIPKLTITDKKLGLEITKVFKDKEGKEETTPTEEKTFYIGVFTDAGALATCTEGETNPRQVVIGTDGKSQTVKFTGLAPQTYYIYETDAQGNRLTTKGTTDVLLNYDGNSAVSITGDEGTYYPFISGGNEIALPVSMENGTSKSITLENRYDGPQQLKGKITIKKLVVDSAGDTLEVDTTFYAHVYKVVGETKTQVEPENQPIELKNEDTVDFSFTMTEEDKTATYEVVECDQEGNDLDGTEGSFA